MEGGLLDVATGMKDCTQPMKAVVSAPGSLLLEVEWQCRAFQEVH
jgi:hypothetical protein